MAVHRVDCIDGGVNDAWETVALFSLFTDNLHTPVRSDISEWSGRLEVDWIPTNLCESVSIVVNVGAGDVWSPVSTGMGGGTPDTSFLNRDTRWVDVVTVQGDGC